MWLTTWRRLMKHQLGKYPGETIISIVPGEYVLDIEFDCGFGSPQGIAFTAWTQNRVLFPVVYDGAESVSSVPRNPTGEATVHVGGY